MKEERTGWKEVGEELGKGEGLNFVWEMETKKINKNNIVKTVSTYIYIYIYTLSYIEINKNI